MGTAQAQWNLQERPPVPMHSRADQPQQVAIWAGLQQIQTSNNWVVALLVPLTPFSPGWKFGVRDRARASFKYEHVLKNFKKTARGKNRFKDILPLA
jgi:hypothetical protein